MDRRIAKVADILVSYSLNVRKGENVIIQAGPKAKALALECYRLCMLRGAHPRIDMEVPETAKIFFRHASDAQLQHFPSYLLHELKQTDAMLYLGGSPGLSKIPSEKLAIRRKTMQRLYDYRVDKVRWCIFEFPTKQLAKKAGMSFEAFTDFVFDSCIKDWNKERERMRGLQALVNRTDKVRIIGFRTDISFSIRGRNAVISDGKRNMPSGEVFTSVVENSAEGEIFYEFPCIYAGREVSGVYLKFKNGKVTEAKAKKNNRHLQQMLGMDKGSRVIGEFGIGYNYGIKRHVKNILFDEKIGGTIHLALGSSYKECKGKNKSALHWDMIKDTRKKGRVFFDDKLVMQNGRWFIPR